MTTTVIFSGQGSQAVGMGKDLYDNFPIAKAVFDEVDDTLNEKLSDIIFDGDSQTLEQTQNSQPAIMAVGIAILRTLQQEADFNIKNMQFAAGHSLGEYTALCATEGLSLSATATLLKARGNAMSETSKKAHGGMISLLGADPTIAHKIADKASTSDNICEVSNDNSFGQIVLSGHTEALERATKIAYEEGIKMVKPLAVSAPFHCSLMQPAQALMKPIIQSASICSPIIPIISNITAQSQTNPDEIKQNLLLQIIGGVRWRESILYAQSKGTNHLLELGFGGILTRMTKRISSDLTAECICNPETIKEYISHKQ